MWAGTDIPETMSEQELLRLLSPSVPADRLWILLGCDAGLRISEILRVCPDSVVNGVIHVLGKGGKRRRVPCTDRLRRILDAEEIERILSVTHDTVPYVRVTARTLERRFKSLARRAGVLVPGRTPHTLRHSYACRLVEAGVAIHVVQRLLGHARLATTSVYLHASHGHLAAGVRRLNKLIAAGRQTRFVWS